MISHEEQQKIWDEEHTNPNMLLQMDSDKPSSGVRKFWNFLKDKGSNLKGIEMGCGKGRNAIWLAEQDEIQKMFAFDFSPKAIEIANIRLKAKGLENKIECYVGDATLPWPHESNYFDFVVDCFASTDIESKEGRDFAVSEMYRIIKPEGYLLAYVLTPENEFHNKMIHISPADEQNAFYHKTGKFEKVFDEKERMELYKNFKLVKEEIIEKTTQFFGDDYKCYDACMIFQK